MSQPKFRIQAKGSIEWNIYYDDTSIYSTNTYSDSPMSILKTIIAVKKLSEMLDIEIEMDETSSKQLDDLTRCFGVG